MGRQPSRRAFLFLGCVFCVLLSLNQICQAANHIGTPHRQCVKTVARSSNRIACKPSISIFSVKWNYIKMECNTTGGGGQAEKISLHYRDPWSDDSGPTTSSTPSEFERKWLGRQSAFMDRPECSVYIRYVTGKSDPRLCSWHCYRVRAGRPDEELCIADARQECAQVATKMGGHTLAPDNWTSTATLSTLKVQQTNMRPTISSEQGLSESPTAMATATNRRTHTSSPHVVFPKQPNFAPRLEGETLSLQSYTTLQNVSDREVLTAALKRSVSLTEGMFLSVLSNQRASKPVFAHRCWASQFSSPNLDADSSAEVFNLFINGCEAPGFLAAVLRGGPRRETRGGFTFGFGSVQLKTFVGSQFWLHCKASVCNDSFSCYPRCTDIVRKANFEPLESNATSSAFVVTDGPFQFSAEEDTEARNRRVSVIVWILLSVCSVLILANTIFIICNELNGRPLRKKNKTRL